jgi:hypothetical protein
MQQRLDAAIKQFLNKPEHPTVILSGMYPTAARQVARLTKMEEKTNMPIPTTAFAAPSADEKAQNPDYWNGYALGQASSGIVPGPAGAADYYDYRNNRIWPLFKPQAIGFFPVAGNVGYDNALMDAANWLWVNDQASPHNKTTTP